MLGCSSEIMDICYLCGEAISDAASNDHIPPRQLLPPALRRRFNLSQLAKLPTHRSCNESYSSDEQYFATSLAPIASESPTGQAMVDHFSAQFRSGRSVPLGYKVLRQFEDRPGGLHLPPDRIVVRLEGDRIERVLWKVIRGLFARV
jgi:hypothetical protein